MKIKKEYRELLAINKLLIFSDLDKNERDKIMDYIQTLHNEVEILKEENEELKKAQHEKN
jgi:hypothetical protein